MSGQTTHNSAQTGNNLGNTAANTLKKGLNAVQGTGELIRENINGFADSVTNSDPKNSHSTNQQHLNEMNNSQGQGATMPLKSSVPHGQNWDTETQAMPQHGNLGANDSKR